MQVGMPVLTPALMLTPVLMLMLMRVLMPARPPLQALMPRARVRWRRVKQRFLMWKTVAPTQAPYWRGVGGERRQAGAALAWGGGRLSSDTARACKTAAVVF